MPITLSHLWVGLDWAVQLLLRLIPITLSHLLVGLNWAVPHLLLRLIAITLSHLWVGLDWAVPIAVFLILGLGGVLGLVGRVERVVEGVIARLSDMIMAFSPFVQIFPRRNSPRGIVRIVRTVSRDGFVDRQSHVWLACLFFLWSDILGSGACGHVRVLSGNETNCFGKVFLRDDHTTGGTRRVIIGQPVAETRFVVRVATRKREFGLVLPRHSLKAHSTRRARALPPMLERSGVVVQRSEKVR